MNQVVNFLSMLSSDEENGGVRRMLGVCSEFERIAKVVLDKADKESHSRRKRKNTDEKEQPKARQPSIQQQGVALPTPGPAPIPANLFTPPFNSGGISPTFNSPQNGFPPATNGDLSMMADYSPGDFASMLTPNGIAQPFSDMPQFSNGDGSPLDMGTFNHPFVPQDLWQMPMTLEWDWADMTAINYPPADTTLGQQPPNGPL